MAKAEATEPRTAMEELKEEVGEPEEKFRKKVHLRYKGTNGLSIQLVTMQFRSKKTNEWLPPRESISIGDGKNFLDIEPDEEVLAEIEEKVLNQMRKFCKGKVGGSVFEDNMDEYEATKSE